MNSNITIEPSPVGKGRKRVVNKQNWEREKAKTQRYVCFASSCLAVEHVNLLF